MNKNFTSFLLFVLLIQSVHSQFEKASLMRIRDPYGLANTHHTYKPLTNGGKVLTGTIGYTIEYNNWRITNPDSIPQNLRNYVAVFDKNDSVLWVKYISGEIRTVEADSKSNIYVTGTYKDRLHTSDGDTLVLLSNNTNYYGNSFIIKIDSSGRKKWWKTSDNEARVQDPSYGDYIKIDPDLNVYVAGHYDFFIRFNSSISFTNHYSGYMPFLAKLDSNGNYAWVRDWYSDSGLPSGLEIDSCRIYMFNVSGASQTDVRVRKFDFSGRLLDKVSIRANTTEHFWARIINVKNDRLVMISSDNGQKKIGFYDLKGNRIWSINYSVGIAITGLSLQARVKYFFQVLAIVIQILSAVRPYKAGFFGVL